MYNEHFNLDENPFSIAPDPRYLYMSEKHREALAHLLYGLESDGGFVLLTGEVGTGKTTVCRCLLEQLPENINIALVLNPKLTSLELLAAICDELGITPDDRNSIKSLVDSINSYLLENHAIGKKTVLIIDEAQNLDPDVLEQLRLLTNLETNQRKLLQVVILGQPELRDMLAKTELRQLAQRITARFHLGPLDRKEVGPYISHRLAVAGYRRKLFSERVINKIFQMTGGIPRLINVLCDRCLLGTYVQGREQVNQQTLKQAAKEVFGGEKDTLFAARPAFMWGMIIIATCLTAIILNLDRLSSFYSDQKPASTLPTENKNVETVSTNLSVETPVEEPIEQKELLWPDEIPRTDSLTLGYMELFHLWGKNYDTASTLPHCQQAELVGLSCLQRRGSLGELVHLNRPALLRMVDNVGAEFYAPLIKFDKESVTFNIYGEEKNFPITVLDHQWFGSYTILWQPPVGFAGTFKPDSGTGDPWLREKLAMISGKDLTGIKLEPLVLEYQRREGLIADGIVGPETIIHINSSIGNPVPELKGK